MPAGSDANQSYAERIVSIKERADTLPDGPARERARTEFLLLRRQGERRRRSSRRESGGGRISISARHARSAASRWVWLVPAAACVAGARRRLEQDGLLGQVGLGKSAASPPPPRRRVASSLPSTSRSSTTTAAASARRRARARAAAPALGSMRIKGGRLRAAQPSTSSDASSYKLGRDTSDGSIDMGAFMAAEGNAAVERQASPWSLASAGRPPTTRR